MMPLVYKDGKTYYILDTTKGYNGTVVIRQPLANGEGMRMGVLKRPIVNHDINRMVSRKYLEEEEMHEMEDAMGISDDHDFW